MCIDFLKKEKRAYFEQEKKGEKKMLQNSDKTKETKKSGKNSYRCYFLFLLF